MMTNRQIEERLNWLTQTVVKISKNCNVKIDKEVSEVQSTTESELLELSATIVELEYDRCMEVIDNVQRYEKTY